MTVEIPEEKLKSWIEDLEQADSKLAYEFWVYGGSDTQALLQDMLDEMQAALPADKED
ncbi:MAG: hypothetical protein LBT40_15885 [Deltaproteobacteria bacterium]|jgi:hypothetical protein|nr:hypothetical protein [Deltaproteobacteria bacterium]